MAESVYTSMANYSVNIHRLRVRLYTSHEQAAFLQQVVSQIVRTILPKEISTVMQNHCIQNVKISWVIERLMLDLGELPLAQFETHFVQRFIQQLNDALSAMSLPQNVNVNHTIPEDDGVRKNKEEPLSTEITGQQKLTLPDEPQITAKLSSSENRLDNLIYFFHTGYWLPSFSSFLVVDSNPEESGEAVEQRVKPQTNTLKVSPTQSLDILLNDTTKSELRVLPMLARAIWHPQSRCRLWQNASDTQRRLIFQQLTARQQLISAPQALPIHLASLMLAAWHYWLHHPSLMITGGVLGNSQVFEALVPAEIHWLNDLLLASVPWPKLLAEVLPLLRKHADVWKSQLSFTALQLLWDRKPHIQKEGRAWQTDQSKEQPPDLQKRTTLAPESLATEAHLQLHNGVTRPPNKQKVNDVPSHDVWSDDSALPTKLSVCNAGIVFLWPLLPRLFAQLGLLEKLQEDAPYRFINQQAQLRAVCLLDGLTWADNEIAEWRCLVNKWLCGWPLTAPLEPWVIPDDSTQTLLTSWLINMSQQIPGLQCCEPAELRALFLQRQGAMYESPDGWHLTVETHASDIMLSRLPWPLKQLTLPWLPEPLEVVWQLSHYFTF
ncbi:contractile injection system tape measure protein [Xenorhabdus szentirmaii]|uniref:contractile injection system tape measure protein n=1 Tax=Xenorhabdus szentirmaii TaxID=290112 RepID=UPI0032B7AE8D